MYTVALNFWTLVLAILQALNEQPVCPEAVEKSSDSFAACDSNISNYRCSVDSDAEGESSEPHLHQCCRCSAPWALEHQRAWAHHVQYADSSAESKENRQSMTMIKSMTVNNSEHKGKYGETNTWKTQHLPRAHLKKACAWLFYCFAHTRNAPPGFFNFFLQLQGKDVPNKLCCERFVQLASVCDCLPACNGSPGLLDFNLFLFTFITSQNTDLFSEHLVVIQLSSNHFIAFWQTVSLPGRPSTDQRQFYVPWSGDIPLLGRLAEKSTPLATSHNSFRFTMIHQQSLIASNTPVVVTTCSIRSFQRTHPGRDACLLWYTTSN